jgi:hypothetical protein
MSATIEPPPGKGKGKGKGDKGGKGGKGKGKGTGKGKGKGKGDKGGKDGKTMKTMKKAPMKTMKAMKLKWPRGETMRIFVKPKPLGPRAPLLVKGSDTIDFVKTMISNVPGWDIEVWEQRLKFAGQQLAAGHTLSYYNIANGDILFLYEAYPDHMDYALNAD